jgi:hypothetical protein
MIRDTTGGHVAKRQLEELTIRAAQDFDAFYELRHARAYPNQDSGPILVISADGKGVVMRPCDLREPTRKAAEARTRKMGTRLSKGEKKNAKRMATVAAVYTIMPFVRQPEDLIADSPFQRQGPAGPRPEQKRVWASLEKDPEQVIAEAVAEARYRDPCGKKSWVALVDGNRDQLRILRRMAKKNRLDLTIIVDLIHVIEYLWKAACAAAPQCGACLLKAGNLLTSAPLIFLTTRPVCAMIAILRKVFLWQRESSKEPAGTWLKIEWRKPGLVGACPALRRCCACALCGQAATLKSTGDSMRLVNTKGIIKISMLPVKFRPSLARARIAKAAI